MDPESMMGYSDRPPPVGRVISILKIGPTDVGRFIVLGDRLWGQTVHWSGKRSLKCREPRETCPHCVKELPKRWVGFLHCYYPLRQAQCFLELTPLAGQNFLLQLAEKVNMRGKLILVKRERESKMAPLQIEVYGDHPGMDEMPPSADPTATLQRLWNIEF